MRSDEYDDEFKYTIIRSTGEGCIFDFFLFPGNGTAETSGGWSRNGCKNCTALRLLPSSTLSPNG